MLEYTAPWGKVKCFLELVTILAGAAQVHARGRDFAGSHTDAFPTFVAVDVEKSFAVDGDPPAVVRVRHYADSIARCSKKANGFSDFLGSAPEPLCGSLPKAPPARVAKLRTFGGLALGEPRGGFPPRLA